MSKLWVRYEVERRWVDQIDDYDWLGIVKEHFISLTLSKAAYLASPNIRLVIVTDAVEKKGVLAEVPNQRRLRAEKLSRSSPHSQDSTTLVLKLPKSRMYILYPISQKLLIKSAGTLKILYDHVHAFTLESRTKFIALQATDDFAEFSESAGDNRTTYRYAATVLPVGPQTPAYSSIPELAVREIGRYIVEDEEDPIVCAKTLLKYSLISTSWSHLFHDLVWTHSSWRLGPRSRPSPSKMRSLTASLRAYPENARRMVCYPAVSLADYSEKDLVALSLCAEFLFGAAIHLTSITLRCYELNQSKGALAQLREVEKLEVWGQETNLPKELLPVEMGEVLETICLWPRLEILVVNGWVGDRNQYVPRVNAPAAYRLKNLTLSGPKRLAIPLGTHLTHLVSYPSQHQRVEELRLEYIQGLSNLDLLNFLLVVAPTLKKLSIQRCKILPPPPNTSQEPALDASIGSMLQLETAMLQGDLVSTLQYPESYRC